MFNCLIYTQGLVSRSSFYVQMKTLRLYPYMSGAGYLVLVCQLVYATFLIYYMWVEGELSALFTIQPPSQRELHPNISFLV